MEARFSLVSYARLLQYHVAILNDREPTPPAKGKEFVEAFAVGIFCCRRAACVCVLVGPVLYGVGCGSLGRIIRYHVKMWSYQPHENTLGLWDTARQKKKKRVIEKKKVTY